ncbi:MAG: ATP-binding protein [Actinomycetaceae bacterium]|nr:ATP-binding protein [Actinomycetaceae bacterium]MDU0969892.1 ATP-binding protein [Actinomycetaceae bacterium]
MVSYAVYPGTSKGSLADGPRLLNSGRLVGPIPDIVNDTVDTVSRNSRTGGVIEGAFRKDLPDYSPGAIREAITNALMHRDYSDLARGTQVQLNIFVDHLEIQNPGGLYGTVTLNDLDKDGVSRSRNQTLAVLLELTPSSSGGYVAENRGSGFHEMLTQQERALLPPPIPQDRLTSFSLRFDRRRMTEAEGAAVSGTSSSDRIVAYLSEHALASSKELAAAAGIGIGGTRKILAGLIDEGLIERTEPARSPKQKYRLTPRT